MRNAGKTITLYSHSLDPETGYDVWSGQVIKGVSVFGTTAVSVGSDGLASADVYTIRVPESCGEFLFQEGDLIVLGETKKHGGHWKVVCN